MNKMQECKKSNLFNIVLLKINFIFTPRLKAISF